MFRKVLLSVFCVVFLYSTDALAASGDMAKIGGDAIIEEGVVVDDVAVVFGDLTVNGTVSKDVAVIGGDLEVGPTGKILGKTVVIFGKLVKSPGAEVNNDMVEIFPFSRTCVKSYAFPVLGLFAMGSIGVILLAGFVVIFLLIALVFTDRVGRSSFYIETFPWRALIIGFVSALLVLPVILLLAVSVLGIPLIPLFIFIILAATFFGYTAVCQLIGLKFFRAIKKPGRHMFWEVLVGFIIISVIVMIPFVGVFIKFLAWIIGFGATMATKFGSRQ